MNLWQQLIYIVYVALLHLFMQIWLIYLLFLLFYRAINLLVAVAAYLLTRAVSDLSSFGDWINVLDVMVCLVIIVYIAPMIGTTFWLWRRQVVWRRYVSTKFGAPVKNSSDIVSYASSTKRQNHHWRVDIGKFLTCAPESIYKSSSSCHFRPRAKLKCS